MRGPTPITTPITVSKITGGDGVTRDMLRIPGGYRGKDGFFEFIKEANGSINHRLFKPN
jgi:filamentous hemagglutinin